MSLGDGRVIGLLLPRVFSFIYCYSLLPAPSLSEEVPASSTNMLVAANEFNCTATRPLSAPLEAAPPRLVSHSPRPLVIVIERFLGSHLSRSCHDNGEIVPTGHVLDGTGALFGRQESGHGFRLKLQLGYRFVQRGRKVTARVSQLTLDSSTPGVKIAVQRYGSRVS